ncbi:MAG TPA: hypothetical protein VN578_12360 [Candidatus Binatia bacterium]|jgi:hypothetical protein|nr:hypothetical protein [Candidatus Binatia bacterium]
MAKTASANVRPMNVHVAPGSSAEKAFRALAGLPGQPAQPEVIAPGVRPAPAHDLVFHGGKTISSLLFKNFYVGGAQAWQVSDIQSIDQALAAAMSDQDLNNVMVQYFPGKITSTALPSEILAGPPPAVVSQTDVENLVRGLYAQNKLAALDLTSTVFNFMLPSGTVLNTDTTPAGPAGARPTATARRRPAIPHDEDDSLNGLGGYHGSVHITKAGGGQDTIYYAVGAFSEKLADGSTNGILAFPQPWKNVVATFYHELNEARTDSDISDAIAAGNNPNATKFLGWTSRQGEECGDFPVFEANPLSQVFQEISLVTGAGKVPVQFQYSNAVHGPEGPIAQPHSPAVHGHKPAGPGGASASSFAS